MITPKQSEDLRLLAELRNDPALLRLRSFLIWLTRGDTHFPAFSPGTPAYYTVNKVLNLIDRHESQP